MAGIRNVPPKIDYPVEVTHIGRSDDGAELFQTNLMPLMHWASVEIAKAAEKEPAEKSPYTGVLPVSLPPG